MKTKQTEPTKDRQKIQNKLKHNKIKKNILESNVIIGENFIKVRPLDGGVTFLPLIEIRYIDCLPAHNQLQNDKGELIDQGKEFWLINYALVTGDNITDSTQFNKCADAEKIAEQIILKLPKPEPITTIQQPILPPAEQDTYEEIGDRPPIGFCDSSVYNKE